jgi:hypothetical protein
MFLHIREEDQSSRSKHLPCACKPIIIGSTSSPKVDRGFTVEDEYVFTTRDLTFPKKTGSQIATNLRRTFQDLELDPGSTP